jgi:glycosyltransferase involved in cell wall biosynthesis
MEQVTDSTPAISVIMPVYNSRRYLDEAVESILQQSFQNFEFLIFDDGSTDGSRERLQKYANKDARIQLFLRKHGGLTPLLNEGISRSRGKYIARMDSDDIALPNRFATQIEYLTNHPDCVAVGSEVLRIDPNGLPIGIKGQPTDHAAIHNNFLNGQGGSIIHPSALFPRVALEKIGGYKPELEPAEDFDLFIRLAGIGKLANLPQVLLKYRLHFNRTTDRRRVIQLEKVHAIVTRAWAEHGLGIPPENLLETQKIMSPIESRYHWARTAMNEGYYLTSSKHLLILLGRKPYSLKTWRMAVRALAKLAFVTTGLSV